MKLNENVFLINCNMSSHVYLHSLLIVLKQLHRGKSQQANFIKYETNSNSAVKQ